MFDNLIQKAGIRLRTGYNRYGMCIELWAKYEKGYGFFFAIVDNWDKTLDEVANFDTAFDLWNGYTKVAR